MKKSIIGFLLALILLPFSANAQYTAAWLEINRKDGVYAVGDSIKVWVTVSPECNPVQEFTVQEDMIRDIRRQEMALSTGRHLVYAGVCDKPVNNAASKDKQILFFPYRPHQRRHMPEQMLQRWIDEVESVREEFRKDYLTH